LFADLILAGSTNFKKELSQSDTVDPQPLAKILKLTFKVNLENVLTETEVETVVTDL
jgi:hypothetical protein